MNKGKYLLLILSGIVLLSIIALYLLISHQESKGYVAEDTPSGVIYNYIYAIQKRDFDRAYSYLADGRGKPSLAFFKSIFYNERRYFASVNVLIMDERIIKAKTKGVPDAVVEFVIVDSDSTAFIASHYTSNVARLVQQDGKWKIIYFPCPYWGLDWYVQGKDL